MWQPWCQGNLGENGYMCMYCWVPLLSTWNYHYIVNWLYSSTNKKLKKKKSKCLSMLRGGLALYSFSYCLPGFCIQEWAPQSWALEAWLEAWLKLRPLSPHPRPCLTLMLVIKEQREPQELGDQCSLIPGSDTNNRLVCNLEQIISVLWFTVFSFLGHL